jgi:hypothetical protein
MHIAITSELPLPPSYPNTEGVVSVNVFGSGKIFLGSDLVQCHL